MTGHAEVKRKNVGDQAMWGPQRILSSSVFLTLPRTWVGQLHNGTTGTSWSGEASVKCSDPTSESGVSGLVLLSCEELPKGTVFARIVHRWKWSWNPWWRCSHQVCIVLGRNTGDSLLWAAEKPPAYMCSEEEPLSWKREPLWKALYLSEMDAPSFSNSNNKNWITALVWLSS